MSDQTTISWCDATFNPWWGCAKVSPACDHCYAERDSKRFAAGKVLWGVDAERRTFGDAHWNEPLRWARTLPAKLGRRPRVFCASMADVFDKNAPPGARARLLKLIEATPELDWLLLTKRIGNAERMYFEARGVGLPFMDNLWIGATVVNQEEADRDIPKLITFPARVRFLSIEPMLGPIDLDQVNGRAGNAPFSVLRARLPSGYVRCVDHAVGHCFGDCPGRLPAVDWVIVGGESGPGARPMPPDWARALRDQCATANVPFHFKQWGEWGPYPVEMSKEARRAQPFNLDEPRGMWKCGKKAAGRLLDGIEHNGVPTP